MAKQRNKVATKENSVEDVKKDEQLPVSEENTVQEPKGTDNDGLVGSEPGTPGPDGDDGNNSGEGEEPPTSDATTTDGGHQDESGPEGAAGVDGREGPDYNRGETPSLLHFDEPAVIEPSATGEDKPITTLSELAESIPAPVIDAEPTSDKATAIVAYIKEYVIKMEPSKYQDAKSGVPQQKRLYNLISELSKLEFLDFKVGMDSLLNLIFDYRHAAFSAFYSRRFFENLYPSLTHEQIREFDDLLNILVTVGSATNRSRAMTQVDLAATLKSVKNPLAQQNLAAYFSALR